MIAQSFSFSPCPAVTFSNPPRLRPTVAASTPKTFFLNSLIYRKPHKLTTSSIINKKSRRPPCGSSNDVDHPKDPATFFDENGAVEDMDGYLNYLSLEYDSVWDTKPSWCQPWTIVSTGMLLITGSWFVLHSVIVTSVVLSLICAWWYIFLVSYPQAYTEMIADRRKRVRSGAEDIYGSARLEGRDDAA
ncbi:OLC1v1007283C1 [Oldenlandia corymbosa var. corymbosa]|uniref:OLC1v1007283C1 n=1 Tax=Oldenlandia corymbosa var. corymbosa TaxID=529605 RepID=A0AAV1DLB0_OLDCO|nr:OLC1v1007283C1 [Oldenlandia corymbosa var. corymbosa]